MYDVKCPQSECFIEPTSRWCTYTELCSRDVELETAILVSSSKQWVKDLVWRLKTSYGSTTQDFKYKYKHWTTPLKTMQLIQVRVKSLGKCHIFTLQTIPTKDNWTSKFPNQMQYKLPTWKPKIEHPVFSQLSGVKNRHIDDSGSIVVVCQPLVDGKRNVEGWTKRQGNYTHSNL